MIRRFRDIALLATAFLPLVFARGLANPFLTPREIALRLILAVALPLAVAVAPQPRRPGPLGAAALALLAAAAAGTVFSVDVANSTWSNPERFTGFLDVALAVGYGAALAQAFRDTRFRARFLWLWIGVWAAVCLWALLEKAVPGFWAQFNGDGARSVATIGNAIFLAHGIILATPPIVAALRMRPGRAWRIASRVALGLAGAAVLATGTRGALLGVLAGGAVAAMAYAAWSRHRAARVAAVAVPLACLLALGGMFLARDVPGLQEVPVVGRVLAVFQRDASTVQRLQLWGVALEAVRQRPLTGWGPENFDTALDRNYDTALTRYGVNQSFSDRAHNGLLDVAAAYGLLGVAAYLAFLGALGRTVLRARQSGAAPAPVAAVLLGGLAAYLVTSLTAFDSQITLLGLAVFAAFVAALGRETQAASLPFQAGAKRAMLAAAAAVPMAVVAWSVVPLARGAQLVHVAVVAPQDAALQETAASLLTFANPYRAIQGQRIANEIFKRVGNAPTFLPSHADGLRAAEALLRDAVVRRPGNFSARYTLANVLLLQAVNGMRPHEDALAVFEEARVLAPRRQMVDLQIGNLHLTRGDGAAAEASFRAAVALDPTVPEVHWHWGRGLAVMGDLERAAQEFRVAWESGLRQVRPEQEYATAYAALQAAGDLATIRDITRFRSENDTQDPDLFASLAAVHAALGEREEAIAALLRAVALDPALRAEALLFLRQNGYPEDVLPPL